MSTFQKVPPLQLRFSSKRQELEIKLLYEDCKNVKLCEACLTSPREVYVWRSKNYRSYRYLIKNPSKERLKEIFKKESFELKHKLGVFLYLSRVCGKSTQKKRSSVLLISRSSYIRLEKGAHNVSLDTFGRLLSLYSDEGLKEFLFG